ncbi:hypothetical protein JXQ70_14020 [bacterium]|nr:hypothetical protein [bacterium]
MRVPNRLIPLLMCLFISVALMSKPADCRIFQQLYYDKDTTEVADIKGYIDASQELGMIIFWLKNDIQDKNIRFRCISADLVAEICTEKDEYRFILKSPALVKNALKTADVHFVNHEKRERIGMLS